MHGNFVPAIHRLKTRNHLLISTFVQESNILVLSIANNQRHRANRFPALFFCCLYEIVICEYVHAAVLSTHFGQAFMPGTKTSTNWDRKVTICIQGDSLSHLYWWLSFSSFRFFILSKCDISSLKIHREYLYYSILLSDLSITPCKYISASARGSPQAIHKIFSYACIIENGLMKQAVKTHGF